MIETSLINAHTTPLFWEPTQPVIMHAGSQAPQFCEEASFIVGSVLLMLCPLSCACMSGTKGHCSKAKVKAIYHHDAIGWHNHNWHFPN